MQEQKIPQTIINIFRLAKQALRTPEGKPDYGAVKEVMSELLARHRAEIKGSETVRPGDGSEQESHTYSDCCDSYIQPDMLSYAYAYSDAYAAYVDAVNSGAPQDVINTYDVIRHYYSGGSNGAQGIWQACCTS